jgi:hypothetical protein
MPAKPTKLTVEMVKGRWQYAWGTTGSWQNGYIEFYEDGSYVAQHDPNTTTIYHGWYAVSDSTIVITEWCYDLNTGPTWNGQGTSYLFDFGDGLKGWPTLEGKSSGGFNANVANPGVPTIPLKLKDRKP